MKKTGKIILWSIRALFYLIIIAVNVIVIWRVCFSGDPSEVKTILVNENTLHAYEEHGDSLLLETQDQRTITSSGLFSVTNYVFIPEAKQLQITVRYNNSTLRKVSEKYGLDEIPNREDTVFDVSVVKTTDLTPENTDDNIDPETLSEERFFPSEVKNAYKRLYSYRKFIFDGISYEDAVGIFADIYYIDDVDYVKEPYGALCLYDNEMPIITKSLTGADKRVLKKALEKEGK